MVIVRCYDIEGEQIPLVISDEAAALTQAKSQGRAVLGISDKGEFLPVPYVAESLDDVDEIFAKRVIKRQMGIAWEIAETERLVIREFRENDWDKIELLPDDVFREKEFFEAYIRSQYPFYEYGMWALEEKKTGSLVGRAGVWDGEECPIDMPPESLEMGYHIFSLYRGQGYAMEACRAIQNWCREEEAMEGRLIYTRIDPENQDSIRIAKKLSLPVYLPVGYRKKNRQRQLF